MAAEISHEVWTALQFMKPEDRAEYVFKAALEKAPSLLHSSARQPVKQGRFHANPLNDFLYNIGEKLGLIVTKIEVLNVTGADLFEITITTVRAKDAQGEHTMKFAVSDSAEVVLREQFRAQTMGPEFPVIPKWRSK